ncbi:MAG: FAD-dependent monooxygenase [Burkholderiales bacterium]
MTAGADVVVYGAGPVGCTLALALAGSRHRVSVVDPGGAPRAGLRPIALSHASRLILERVGAWGSFPVTPIETIQVSQALAFGRARLDAADARVPALGYVARYGELVSALRSRVAVQAEAPPDEARCTVHAEGISSGARERGYGREVLVARVSARPAAQATAHERFTAEGPLALLPLAGDWAAVWSLRPDRAAALEQAADGEFLRALQQAFGARAGRFTELHERARAPLALRVRGSRVEGRAVFVGNAAQTLHPVAGQGLNLGLRDAWDLAQLLADAPDPGEPALLGRFAAQRRLDAAATIGATEFLARGFLGDHALLRAMRGLALTSFDILPPARRFFARRMIFGPSALP